MTRGRGGIGINLFELIKRPVAILRRLMMLDQHHGDIVAFLRSAGLAHDQNQAAH
jgi:hypothetical protein